MSVVARVSRGKNRSLSSTGIAVILGLLAVLFLIRYGQELLLEHDLNDKTAAQRGANAALRDDNARLKATLQYVQSSKYIEQRAREDLNLRRADEEVLIPTNLDAAASAQTEPGSGPAAGDAAEPSAQPSNAEKWFGLFAPANPLASSP